MVEQIDKLLNLSNLPVSGDTDLVSVAVYDISNNSMTTLLDSADLVQAV